MRIIISFIAALWLSVTGTSGLASLTAPLAAPVIAAAAPVALVLLNTSKAEAQRRRAGGQRGGHRSGVRSRGRHTVNRGVHRGASRRPRPSQPVHRPGRPGYRPERPATRPPNYTHYSHRDVYHYYRPGYRGYYGYGAGVAAGVAASLAVGTVVASLPRECTNTTINGVYYHHCGNTWYAPQYAGSDVTYVVVNDPR